MIPLAAHADWSVSPAKRWMSVAAPDGDGWRVGIERVGALETLLPRLLAAADGRPAALGVDAPIGLPMAFSRGGRFPDFLRSLAADDPFFTVCADAGEIGLGRPFYPRTPKLGMRRRELHDGLGLVDSREMLRRCEQRSDEQPEAAPMFWTVGAKQVGKGALCLWRDLLLPALRSPDPPLLWPFDGGLAALLRPGRITVAECYPAGAMLQMKLRMQGSKRRQSDRVAVAGALRAKLREVGAEPNDALAAQIEDGFGPAGEGEDRFDSLVGLLRMLEVIRDPALDQLPPEPIRRWEGWILGRPLSIS